MDLQIREFEQSLINFINQVNISIEIKRLVVKDVYTQLEKESDKVVVKLAQDKKIEQDKKKKQENNKENNKENNNECEEVAE